MPEERLAALEKKIDAIYESVEKSRQYLLWTLVITIAVIVLPAIGLMFAVPSFVSNYNETLESLDLEGL
jgi:predicted lysophospholipase L1 biosynthesis ABC-type transport system permease subunit